MSKKKKEKKNIYIDFQFLGMEKMMEGLMKQMFSKEVMYEPVCKVVAEYPNYLDRNKVMLLLH